ncbi:hypothetical protein Pth03_78190 [Planotetraspora thailandica]|uniref:Uncharacterized protein n=1 Tax=Planotetraspora thailandica TaxID=487172 RepID=A0A8J4DFP1_9ACTN|nr:hypothetical protein [Planotetraspora thailandica]GII59430.1 hypothetical protein Pth03_78190 [Planotetraspora thailandica]
MTKNGRMDKEAAARIQSSAARNPGGKSAGDQWDRRAQSAADRNEDQEQDEDDRR